MSFEKVPNFLGNFFTAEMNVDEQWCFQFNSFLLNAAERELLRNGEAISLTPKAFDTLLFLVKNGGHLVSKEELLNAVWPDSFVDEGNVPRTIHTLRKALGQDDNGNKFIETIPTKGYRFIAQVEKATESSHGFVKEVSAENLSPDAASVGSDPIILNEPPSDTSTRRRVLIPAGAIILVALVTGFWMSNGDLLPHPLAVGVVRQSANGEAYRHFQEGKLLVEKRTPASYQQALEQFENAIEIDPTYAEAYAGKADAKTCLFLKSNSHDDIANAHNSVKKALELDESSAYAHTIQCQIIGTYDWEFDTAVSECQRAVTLGPNDSGAHRELGFALNVVGREEEGLAEMATAVALSPTSFNKRSQGIILYMSRRYDEAIGQLEQVEATDPGYTDAERWLMSCFVMKNDYTNAFDHLIKLQETTDATPDDLNAVRAAFASGGWPEAVRVTLESSSGIGKRKSMLIAGLFAQIGEEDRAFEILNDMHKRHAIMMVTVAREPLIDPLRDDERYYAILSQMKLK